MRINIRTTPPRKEPEKGDRRTTKKHGLQIRVQEYSDIYRAWVVNSNGRPRYNWVDIDSLDVRDRWLLTKEEREKYYESVS